MSGKNHTEASKEKNRQAKLGKKQNLSDEAKKSKSEKLKQMWIKRKAEGWTLSEESRNKTSETLKKYNRNRNK